MEQGMFNSDSCTMHSCAALSPALESAPDEVEVEMRHLGCQGMGSG